MFSYACGKNSGEVYIPPHPWADTPLLRWLLQQTVHILLECILVTGHNEVVAKVMFLQLCVIQFTGGSPAGRTSWAGRPPWQGAPPGRKTPQQGEPTWQGEPPGRETPLAGRTPLPGKETPLSRENPPAGRTPPAYGQ